MAEECVDVTVQLGRLPSNRTCITEHMRLVGAQRFTDETVGDLQKRFSIDGSLAHHLAYQYGDRAVKVMEIAKQGFDKTLHSHHPYIEAEVLYAVREEFAQTPVDVLARRTRLFFLDSAAAVESIARILELMKIELQWDEKTVRAMELDALAYFGKPTSEPN